MLDNKDKRLLIQLQDHFPLDPRPYTVIAKRLDLSPVVVQRKVTLLRKKGIIRYIGAVVDTKRIGFKSSLVALAVPRARIREVSEMINSYPEVTHNYLREDEYNMWFTVSARTDQRRAAIIRQICRDSGVQKCLDLSTIKVFKINARFALDKSAPQIRVNASDRIHKDKIFCRRIDGQVLAALALPLDDSERPCSPLPVGLGAPNSRLQGFWLLARIRNSFAALAQSSTIIRSALKQTRLSHGRCKRRI
jgi:DNA-binding Lrp family transcriptional regulator